MERLEIAHHHIILLLLLLAVLLTGIAFGVKIADATRASDGLSIISFSLLFLNIVVSLIIFTQVVHIKDHLGVRVVKNQRRRR